jgi:hypothetical protein
MANARLPLDGSSKSRVHWFPAGSLKVPFANQLSRFREPPLQDSNEYLANFVRWPGTIKKTEPTVRTNLENPLRLKILTSMLPKL